MGSATSAAVDACYEAFGLPATLTPRGGGAAAPVIVRRMNGERTAEFGRTPFALSVERGAAALSVKLRTSDLPAAAEGGRLSLEGRLYDIGPPEPLGVHGYEVLLPLHPPSE